MAVHVTGDGMKRIVFLLVFVCMAICWTGSLAEAEEWFHIEDGMAQPVVSYSDAQRPDYSNENSDILRFVVYVETDYDTDLDGKPDLIKTMVQVPRAAAEGSCRVPAIYEARPYIAGMYMYSNR